MERKWTKSMEGLDRLFPGPATEDSERRLSRTPDPEWPYPYSYTADHTLLAEQRTMSTTAPQHAWRPAQRLGSQSGNIMYSSPSTYGNAESLSEKAFRKSHPSLRQYLNIQAVFPYLNQYDLLTENQQQELMLSSLTDHRKIDLLLLWLPRSGPNFLESFISSLRESAAGTNHEELAEVLRSAYKEVQLEEPNGFDEESDNISTAQIHERREPFREMNGEPLSHGRTSLVESRVNATSISTFAPHATRPMLSRSSTEQHLNTGYRFWRSEVLHRKELEDRDIGPTLQSVPVHQFHQESGPQSQRGGAMVEDLVEEGMRLECEICSEEFQDRGPKVPRNLQCGHTYCTGCIQRLLLASSQSKNFEIECPNRCHIKTLISEGNVAKLAKNFSLIRILSTTALSASHSGSYYSGEDPPPSLGRVGSRRTKPVEESLDVCPEHSDQLSSYCVEDKTLVCSSCLLHGSHKHHKWLLVKEAARQHREKLRELNPEVQKQHQKMSAALSHVERVTEQVQMSGRRLEEEMDAHFDSLLQVLEERKRKLKVEIMMRTQTRVETLLEQAQDLRECVVKASAVYDKASALLSSDDFTVLKESTLTLEQIEGVFINPPPSAPRANDDLTCEFSSHVHDEITSQMEGYGNIKSAVGIIDHMYLQPYHDGIRICWEGHNFADNMGISYHLQMAEEEENYRPLYRGGLTKFTWKREELRYGVPYRFRVQVRTTDGVGEWSKPEETRKAAPAFCWHDTWRNVKIELSPNKLEASWSKGKVQNYWATFAGDRFFEKDQHYVEIEIVDIGKGRPNKKIAIGVIGCTKAKAKSLPWQERQAIGQWKETPAWAFHPISGVKNSNSLPQEGVPYSPIMLQNGDRIGMLVDMDKHKLSFFCNGQDLGVAFENIDAKSLLPAMSIKDKIVVRLRFPPPPLSRRGIRLIQLSSGSRLHF